MPYNMEIVSRIVGRHFDLSITQNVGAGRRKMHDLKMTDWKKTDRFARNRSRRVWTMQDWKMTDKEADFTCCRPRRHGISCCWTAVLLLLLLLVDVDG